VSGLIEALARARAAGNPAPLAEAIPYLRFIGVEVSLDAEGLLGTMRFRPHLVGNALIPALHGGTIGSFLESVAILGLCWEAQRLVEPPRIVNITVEYLRTARTVDTFARAEITRQGRRVATVRALAWQEDVAKPVAAANAHFLVKEG
jgi:acyl-coenzyme A thioesterase PaaI-like protein